MKKILRSKLNQILLLICLVMLIVIGCESNGDMSYSSGGESGQGGSMARFTIKGDYLYTVDRRSLKVFDISNEKKPVYESKTEIGFDIETIFANADYLFIGSETAMYIYNISDPVDPKQLSVYKHIYSCDPVVANDKRAYVTLSASSSCGRGQNELHVVDISNPSNPVELSAITMTGPKGLGLKDNRLYVCDNGYIYVFALDSFGLPTEITNVKADVFDLIPLENSLVAIGKDGFKQFDYSTDTLTLLSEIPISSE